MSRNSQTPMRLAVMIAGTSLLFGACRKPAQCPTTTPSASGTVGAPAVASGLVPASRDPYVAPLLTAPRTVTVDVLWVRRHHKPARRPAPRRVAPRSRTAGGRVPARRARPAHTRPPKIAMRKGGTTRVRLIVSPNPGHHARIGITEQFPGGAGGSWRATVWIAARRAAQAVGREIVDYRFQVASEGFIDGPSAGALFTAGFLAALTGAPVKPEVTMTGTVNPDGTVGVVGGLEHKFLGAIRAGKKVIGYPEGNKIIKGKGGRVVNLENLAAEHGAKAVPVRNIQEAYTLLTGRTLPGHKRLSPKDLALPARLAARLLAQAKTWRAQHRALLAVGKKNLHDALERRFFAKRVRPAGLYLDASRKAERAHHAGAAYYTAVRSATWAYTAAHFTDVLYLFRKWFKLVRKEARTARVKFMRLMAARIAARRRSRREAECKKHRWHSAPCKALRRKLRRERAQKRRAAKAAARRRRQRSAQRPHPRYARRVPPRRTRRGPPPRRAATAAAPTPPPAPPKDFRKMLLHKARAMERRTAKLDTVRAALDKRRPTTVDELLAVVAGHAELVQGKAFSVAAKMRLKRLHRYNRLVQRARNLWTKRRMTLKIADYVDDTVKFAGIAFGKARLAEDLSSMFVRTGHPVHLSEARMRSIANQLFAAAKANLDFIDSLLPSGFRGMMVRSFLAYRSPEFLIAHLGLGRAGKIVFQLREALATKQHVAATSGYAALGAAVASYLASSKLIAKLFTLGIRHKTGTAIHGLKRPVELTNALRRARFSALEAAYRAQRLAGVVPSFSRILFETAEQLRKESLSGQVKALELYWRAALYCRLAEMVTHP